MRAFELKIPPVAWTLIHIIAMWGCCLYLPEFSFGLPGASLVAWLFLLAGLGTASAGVRLFRSSETTVSPLNPEQTSTLVEHGIYRYTRNPMYLGMLLVLLAWFFYLSNLAAAAFPATFVVLLTRLQIIPEERALTQLFPESYPDYCTRVPRWLFRKNP